MKNEVQITEVKPAGSETYKVWKIRRKSDGLFSTGGTWPSFTKKGKEWKTLSALSSHIVQSHRHYDGYHDGDLEIVHYEYELKRFETGTQDVHQYITGLLERRAKREANAKRAAAKYKLEQAKR